MKKLLIMSMLIAFTSIKLNAQQGPITSTAMSSDFKAISQYGGRQTSSQVIQSYSNNEVKGSQFFNPDWAPGTVITTNNEVIGEKYLFLFDRVRHQLFVKLKDSDVAFLADKSQVKSFTLVTDNIHLFISDAKSATSSEDIKFYEVIEHKDNGYYFLKLVTTKFVKADLSDIMRVKSGDFSDEFVNSTDYYLYNPKTGFTKIAFKEPNILKGIEDAEQVEAKAFFLEHKYDKIGEKLVISLVKKLNKDS